jgi:protein gp37
MTITIHKSSKKPAPTAQLSLLEQPASLVDYRAHNMNQREFSQAKQATGIEWTNLTWNPMVGCSVHTAGCKNCYAMKQAGKITAKHYDGVVKWVKGDTVWTGVINQSPPHILNKPRTVREPSMIFVNSMSDFFHGDMDYRWQLAAMQVMAETPRHVYQILTKRPENIAKFMAVYRQDLPRNVWVGATMEREDYRERIDILRDVPAHVKFLSIEPLIGPPGKMNLTDIQWVIVGGESGPNSRSMHIDWVRSTRDQSVAQGVPYFFKQYGIHENNPLFEQGGRAAVNAFDPVGKGGSLIDGVAWKEFPSKHVF